MNKQFIINPLASDKLVVDARRVYDVIVGPLEVKANQAWHRVTISKNCSSYFAARADGSLNVHLGGGNVTRFSDYALFHWGKPRSVYEKEGTNHREWTWIMSEEAYASTVYAVLSKNYDLPDDALVVEEVDAIYENRALPSYEIEALATARIGHSRWAKAIKERFNFGCAIQPAIIRNLIAAHIKPWTKCEGQEKTDIGNGICLSRNMDGLFEDGVISFNGDGTILVSEDLLPEERVTFGLAGDERIDVTEENAPFLAWHRQNKFE